MPASATCRYGLSDIHLADRHVIANSTLSSCVINLSHRQTNNLPIAIPLNAATRSTFSGEDITAAIAAIFSVQSIAASTSLSTKRLDFIRTVFPAEHAIHAIATIRNGTQHVVLKGRTVIAARVTLRRMIQLLH
jgi:hypothetical protein